MKKTIVKLTCSVLLLCSSHLYSQELQEVKCHVELLGGAETIFFAVIPKEPLSQTAKELVNTRILTTLSAEKKQVYKVHECVLESNSFKSSVARSLEKNLEL